MSTREVQWDNDNGHYWRPQSVPAAANLPPGTYQIYPTLMGVTLEPFRVVSDEVIFAEDSHADEIYQRIVKFAAARTRYAKYKILHKRGILMNSKPGFGKTMTCNGVAQKVVESGGIAIFSLASQLRLSWLKEVISGVRAVHPEMLILNIIEDLDKLNSNTNLESVLEFMDGSTQFDCIVHMATTNYIGELDERITKRPGRFDDVITLEPPNEKARRSFIRQLIPADEHDNSKIDSLVKASNGLAWAQIKELTIGYMVLGKPLEAYAKHLLDNMPTETKPRNKKNSTID